MRAIEIVVDGAGNLSIEALRFKGADCEKATRFLEVALGQTRRRLRKPEYLATCAVRQRVRA